MISERCRSRAASRPARAAPGAPSWTAARGLGGGVPPAASQARRVSRPVRAAVPAYSTKRPSCPARATVTARATSAPGCSPTAAVTEHETASASVRVRRATSRAAPRPQPLTVTGQHRDDQAARAWTGWGPHHVATGDHGAPNRSADGPGPPRDQLGVAAVPPHGRWGRPPAGCTPRRAGGRSASASASSSGPSQSSRTRPSSLAGRRRAARHRPASDREPADGHPGRHRSRFMGRPPSPGQPGGADAHPGVTAAHDGSRPTLLGPRRRGERRTAPDGGRDRQVQARRRPACRARRRSSTTVCAGRLSRAGLAPRRAARGRGRPG